MKNFFTQSTAGKVAAASLLSLIILASFGYTMYLYLQTVKKLENLSADFAMARSDYNFKITRLQNDVSRINRETDALTNSLTDEQQKSGSIDEQVGAIGAQLGTINSTVGTLQKLSQTDPELLKKYSKVYFLNENYVPISLTDIDPEYLIVKNNPLQIHSNVAPFLQRLLDDAKASGLSLEIISAYRSFGTQALLKASYRFTYGAGTANSFSAEQGYSEHQLGTAVDFATPATGTGFAGFDKTPEYAWLLANAYKYGFEISYPQSNTYYEFEPWHWRFVGVALATTLHSRNEYFYDMDQREIDTYLADIFDQ